MKNLRYVRLSVTQHIPILPVQKNEKRLEWIYTCRFILVIKVVVKVRAGTSVTTMSLTLLDSIFNPARFIGTWKATLRVPGERLRMWQIVGMLCGRNENGLLYQGPNLEQSRGERFQWQTSGGPAGLNLRSCMGLLFCGTLLCGVEKIMCSSWIASDSVYPRWSGGSGHI